MSRIQQDQFVEDEEDELCPLCVEEFDLSDKNFRPCPCGYQICQFCYNNIKTTLNGLCPACRRPYDDSNIQFRRITPEEMAKHKQQIAQKAKKNAALRQKEAQKAEADSLSRKHLAGLRVVQKNLVYVTGLTPTIREDRLLDTLRGNDYFGQYGKIIKIVVSKARENAQHQQSVGVYVTFARKEDAAACIAAVDGSHNGDRTLRAQYGTTKYCSAYLRGEQCNNRNCMFLHEPGEENDSFTRQDLSMMNSIQTQQPNQSPANAAPPPHRGPAVAAAAAPMHRQESSDTHSPTGDAPGLPATASWGSKAAQERRASRSTIASNSSPMVTNAVPAQAPKVPVKAEEASNKKDKEKDKEKEKEKEKGREKEKGKDKEKEKTAQTVAASQPEGQPAGRPSQAPMLDFVDLLKALPKASFQFVFSSASLSDEDLRTITSYPPLMEPDGGAKRRALREKQRELEAQQVQGETELKAAIPDTGIEQNEDNGEATAGGSLQLGGEPEERHEAGPGQGNRSAIAPPGQNPMSAGVYGPNVSLTDDFANLGLSSRGFTPQQQQQLLLSTIKSGSPQPPGLQSIFPQQQTHGQMGNAPGHARHASRFSFANDTSSASASVQPVANQKLMNQQSSMMPKNTGHFNQISQHQPMGTQFYTSGVQGPPPGLKATGTPPVSGGGMFGQGHGFTASGLGYGATAGARNANDMMYQDLLRGRNMEGGARVDTGKQEPLFSPEEQATANVDALVNDDIQMMGRDISVVPPIYEQPRRATPTIPPGFSAPIAHRALNEYSTPPMSRTASSDITPALPLVPITPVKMPSSQRPRRQGDVVSTPGAPASAANTRPSSPVKRSEKSSSGKSQTMPGVCTAETVELTTQPEESKTKAVVAESPSKPTARSKSGNKKGKDVPAAEATPTKAVKDNTLAIVSKETKDNTPVPTLRKDAKELAPPATPASTSKRQHPGKLDLAVATELLEPSQKHVSSPLKSDTPSKAGRTVSVPLTASSSVPASPAATSTGSPIKRAAAPRTIRVVPTPRTETPPALPAVSTGPPHVPTVDKLRSRQASIASINQPGTPASELISEDASIITSASVSRASSPPLIGGKVGSAPVRKKTKSQAKKERQERARQMLEEQTLALEEQAKAEPEPEHAPIVGRKTKKRKSTANAPKAPAGPAKTQTTSLKDGPTDESEESEPKHPPAPVTGAKNEVDALPSQSSIERTPSSPPLETGPKEKANLSAQAIIADLQKSGELLASTLEFFKPLSSSLAHAVRTAPQSGAPTAPQDAKLHFTQADLEALAKKQPVRLSGPDGNPDSRYLITPQGKFLWGLTKELEDKALELEKHIEELKGPARFHPQQHTPHVPSAAPHAQSGDVLPAIATALKEAGAKLKSGSAAAAVQSMPKIDPSVQNTHQAPAPQQQAPVDAGAYLNQFVLPGTDNPTPNTTRTDMCGVGGPPGAGAGNTSVNIGKIAKAAKVVAEGGTLSNELEGMGVMAADLLGGVVVQGLEWLMNAGLGTNIHQDLSVDGKGNITLGGNGFDVQGLVDAIGSAGGLAGVEAAQGRRGRRSVLSVNEAEQAMLAAKKEYEALEKKLAALMKRNRKLVGATK